uniref:Short transient receptor potential channel 4-like n=1 Tax=Saccoglossus kowalevskii TaxID=10224 RepID=A0ABM0MU10_SACKO|nr:PREDICTED: short transient receptor potential channel 4-like [Saccoglossus kowalevskii]
MAESDVCELSKMTTKEWAYFMDGDDGLTPNEAEFLEMVESGDVVKTKMLLKNGLFDVNCVVMRGMLPVTAIQLAAESNNFQMVRLLLDSGVKRIPKPSICIGEEQILDDDLSYSIFCGLASPAYLNLANRDPVMASMDLANDLQKVTEAKESQMTSVERYIELKNKVQQHTLDLLDCCECSEEVSTLILGYNYDENAERKLLLKGKVVTKAIATKHKKFIAHYKCQNVIRKLWNKGQPGWHCRNSFWWWVLYCIYCLIVYVLLMPLLAVMYIIAPCSSVAKILDNPKAKFLTQMVAYLQFVILGILLNFGPGGMFYADYAYEYFLFCLIIYEIALIWGEIREMRISGLICYFNSFWNYMDLLVLFSFLADSSLRIVSLLSGEYVNPEVNLFWITWTALILTVACLRFLNNFYLSFYLGPMLLIFTAMTSDVIRFLIIFLYTVTAFALGFYYLYDDFGTDTVFSEFTSSFVVLVTTIFGGNPIESLKAKGMVFNLTGAGYGVVDARPMYKTMGFILYASFGTICMLVLLNICIAMMSDTYAKMKNSIEIEYTFMQTKMWLSYVDAPVLPAPYNIIPSVSCLISIVKKCVRMCRPSSNTDEDVELTIPKDNRRKMQTNKGLLYEEIVRNRLRARNVRPRRQAVRLVYWRPGERFTDAIQHNQFGGGSIMEWDGFSYHQRTPLHVIDDKLTGLRYRDEILRPIVLTCLHRIDAAAVPQDENAIPHRARVVTDFRIQHNINRMDWPAYSPGMAPIERLWDQKVVKPIIEMFHDLGFSFSTLLSFRTHATKCVMVTFSPHHLFHCADVSH